MKCPSCHQELTEIFTGGLKVFACKEGCGGLWFGHYELQKLKGQNIGAGERLLNVPRAEGVRFFRNVEAICPQCTTSLLLRHFFNKEIGVEVFQCAKCGGFWLDLGELMALESRFDTEESRRQAAASYFEIIFAGRIAKMDLLIEDVLKAARSIVKILIFVCPEKYLSGNRFLQKEYFSDLHIPQ